MYYVIRIWARLFLRLYFRRTIVCGREHIPPDGPLILASNHPSAFMEASVLGTVMKRPLHFLVRGDVFHPRFRWLFRWTNQIPIYRQKDGMSNLRKNASSFDLTYQRLAEGHAVIIFPEAKTILEKKMRPVQRGTAHLAFGTLPLLKETDTLPILPVGVNFTNPCIPGTDVVIRFGKPFVTATATREDREAIEQFTQKLSDVMSPLIIQVEDHGYEKHYDVLISVYLRKLTGKKSCEMIHDDLNRIASLVNDHTGNKQLLSEVHEYIHRLKKEKIPDAIYFPDVFLISIPALSMLLLLKGIWFVSGGWIWRGARALIFSKIKHETFQGPSSVGVAMVLFPFISILLFFVCRITGLPLWMPVLWWAILGSGKFISAPLNLMWKALMLQKSTKIRLKKHVRHFTAMLSS